MKISIVTISYNQARFLRQAIRSVVEQDVPGLEYIVVDPGSSDGSRKIIEDYSDHIDHIIFEPDSGPGEGLNRGFAQADGDVFGFLNADDFLLPGALQSALDAFRVYRDADVVSGHGWLVDTDGKPIRRKHTNRFDVWRYLHRGAHLLQQSTFFRADAFHKAGGFNEDNRTCWDGELWLDMALAGSQFQVLHDYFSCFRTYSDSISGQLVADPDARRSYEWDRSRMFRRAMGRDPRGLGYGLHRTAAQIAKWGGSPMALYHRLRSLAGRDSDGMPKAAWMES